MPDYDGLASSLTVISYGLLLRVLSKKSYPNSLPTSFKKAYDSCSLDLQPCWTSTSVKFQALKKIIREAKAHDSNRIPLMRVAVPALQRSPLQQSISQTNDPVACLQRGLVSLLQRASDPHDLVNDCIEAPLK